MAVSCDLVKSCDAMSNAPPRACAGDPDVRGATTYAWAFHQIEGSLPFRVESCRFAQSSAKNFLVRRLLQFCARGGSIYVAALDRSPVNASFIDGGRPATFIPAIIFTFYSKIAREDEEQAEAA